MEDELYMPTARKNIRNMILVNEKDYFKMQEKYMEQVQILLDENKQLKMALKICMPLRLDAYNSGVEGKCIWCSKIYNDFEVEHADDCEFVRLTKESEVE